MQEEKNNIPSVKVLLVDDRPENLISLESLLYREGDNIHYVQAGSGEEALKIALKEELALILLDVQMPGMNGYEVARFLRNSSKTKNIPIVFVTAIDQDTSHMLQGFEAGGIDYLFKPLHPEITRAKVNAFVNFYLQKKELERNHEYVLHINRELEERVKERTKELTHINKDLDNFIYTASHDLKAPVNNIEGLFIALCESLDKESKSSDETLQLRGMIFESIERFKTILNELTEIVKIENNVQTDESHLNFAEMLHEVKLNIEDLISETKAEIREDFSAAPSIRFSRKNLRSILHNLVSNAIKYRCPDRTPQISIRSSRSGSTILLAVQDNGLGIKKEDLPKVFNAFQRFHSHVEGSGVGLSIVKRIVENNGGKVEVESELGKGTLFKVYLIA